MRRLVLRLSPIAAFAASLSACVVAPVPTRVVYQESPRYYWGPTHHRDYYRHGYPWGSRGYHHGS